jgi:hypothetical protein
LTQAWEAQTNILLPGVAAGRFKNNVEPILPARLFATGVPGLLKVLIWGNLAALCRVSTYRD